MIQNKKQRGGVMVAVAIGILVMVVAAVGVVAMSYLDAYDYGNRMDNSMIALSDNNRVIYAQGTQKVQEIAQVPGMYTEDFAKVIKQDIEGRYGKDGSKATMQFLQEHDIKLDVALYTKIQQTIEEFRNKFESNQTRLVEEKRSYLTSIGSLWRGFWMRMAGFPKIDLKDPKFNPITTDRTEEVFKAGKENGPLRLR